MNLRLAIVTDDISFVLINWYSNHLLILSSLAASLIVNNRCLLLFIPISYVIVSGWFEFVWSKTGSFPIVFHSIRELANTLTHKISIPLIGEEKLGVLFSVLVKKFLLRASYSLLLVFEEAGLLIIVTEAALLRGGFVQTR